MADILVVDDDPDTAEALSDLLIIEGHQLRVAHDGVEGLACLDARLPNLVLLDVEMPRLNGPEMAFEMFLLNAGREKIPVVLLSGKLDLREVAAAIGTRYFLGKPYSFDVVLSVIARALDERAPPSVDRARFGRNAPEGAAFRRLPR
jgi:DNA-binding NtrC family response regulator